MPQLKSNATAAAGDHTVGFLRTSISLDNISQGKAEVIIDGDSLDIAQLVAVARCANRKVT